MTFPVTSPAVLEFRRYRWLPFLIVSMTALALLLGAFLLRYVEQRLVSASGEELVLAAAEVSEKLDRLLFERHGDARMMARASRTISPGSRRPIRRSISGWA
jgi:two-component system, cell cycle sensor histidine kinase and response regulator CckA